MSRLGIVIIGRNEGTRLTQCLESVLHSGHPIVYIDSGSVDGSPDLARAHRIQVIELDRSTPFGAGRARNTGAALLAETYPAVEFVQFIDGDCTLDSQWLSSGVATLTSQPDVAVVCGRRRERFPEASLYNRLCDLEWDAPTGEVTWCGGDALMRLSAFQRVGGFNTTVKAGEEPELCNRLRAANWRILRIDADMTRHDAAILRFGQWWKRQLRSGYGSLDLACRFRIASFRRFVLSAQSWTICWLIVCGLLAGAAAAYPSTWTYAAAGLWAILPLLQIVRIALRFRSKPNASGKALWLAALMVIGKWGETLGHLQYLRDRLAGRGVALIEYKQPAPAPTTPVAGVLR